MTDEQPGKGKEEEQEPMRPQTICVDFDGVLHSYQRPWAGATVISDPPVPGALKWLFDMAEDERFQACIYSSRSKEPGGVEAMESWIRYHAQKQGFPHDTVHKALQRIEFPTQKPAAFLTIDDRAFVFEGRFPGPEEILRFKPWNKRQVSYYGRLDPVREEGIRAALADISYEDRDSPDHAIGELLEEIDVLRGVLRTLGVGHAPPVLKSGSVEVVVNGAPMPVPVGIATYHDVVRWAQKDPTKEVLFTITWHSTAGTRRNGLLTKGEYVAVEPGMVFNVTHTGSA